MQKTTKVVTVHAERASYQDAVKALQEKIEAATQAIYASSTENVLSLSCTSMTKNHSNHAVHVLTAFILVEVEVEN